MNKDFSLCIFVSKKVTTDGIIAYAESLTVASVAHIIGADNIVSICIIRGDQHVMVRRPHHYSCCRRHLWPQPRIITTHLL